MTIGNKITELRKKNHYTQEKLASLVDVSRQTIANWESDITSPDLKQASILVKIFNITMNELMDTELEIACRKDNTILNSLIGKMCYFDIEENDYRLNFTTLCKVLEINKDFVKIEFDYGKKKIIKLIDIELIYSIRNKVK